MATESRQRAEGTAGWLLLLWVQSIMDQMLHDMLGALTCIRCGEGWGIGSNQREACR